MPNGEGRIPEERGRGLEDVSEVHDPHNITHHITKSQLSFQCRIYRGGFARAAAVTGNFLFTNVDFPDRL